MDTQISLYPDAFTKTGNDRLTVNDFLEKVKNGYWQDQVLPVRVAVQQNKTKDELKKLKTKLPSVTLSGSFKVCNATGLEKHSGFLVIDIDNLGDRLSAVQNDLTQDSLFYTLFISCSGRGLCGLVKINPKAHLESFNFMSEHMYQKYGLNIDELCKDVSRLRFVSYDPDLYLNTDSQITPIKPITKKEKPPKGYIYADEDFKRILEDIKASQIDLTSNYNDWIFCGFSLVDKFGEDGRESFHTISMFHPDYDPDKVDSKYDHLLKSKSGDHTIDWFYHIIEKNGLTAYGKATNDFIQQGVAEKQAYDAGLIDNPPLTHKMLTGIEIPAIDTAIQIRNFLHKGYKIKKNEMTAAIEVNGETLDDELLNTLYILARSVIDKINSRELVYQVLDSRFTPRVHPVKNLMEKYDNEPPETERGHIESFIAALNSPTPHAAYFIKKWLIAIIPSALGQHSVLELVLQGPQNCGKTQVFRRLLPECLKDYYAESKMDEGKDDLILMSKKLIIMDDEMSGKSKQEERKIKSISSKQTMDLRVPFGRIHSTLTRIAMLAGTANDDELIDDPTGNRRRIVVNVFNIDFKAINAIDRELLLYECYLEYKSGFNYELTTDDIKMLQISTEAFTKAVAEEELITKYFSMPGDAIGDIVEMSASEIYDYLKKRTRLGLNVNTLGKYLKKLGFTQERRRFGKAIIRKYSMVENEAKLNDLI